MTPRVATPLSTGPVTKDDGGTISNPTPDAFPADPRALRVVIVEDEAIVAMEVEMLLDDLGAQVVGIAMSAAEAESLVCAHHPDVVTMDINIRGDRNGVSAAIDIFERYGVRAIFISAYSDPATRKQAEPCNPIAWIEKPINPADLADAVKMVERNAD